jgi:hypothetical protein
LKSSELNRSELLSLRSSELPPNQRIAVPAHFKAANVYAALMAPTSKTPNVFKALTGTPLTGHHGLLLIDKLKTPAFREFIFRHTNSSPGIKGSRSISIYNKTKGFTGSRVQPPIPPACTAP